MEKVKTSVIIPYYESDEGKPFVLKRLQQSLSGYDELILVWNDRMGYARAINKGLALARGEFLVVMNDDLVWENGKVSDLCDKKAVTSPKINGESQPFWGCCFCLPRWVYEKIGGLDERYRISYYDDEDYWLTLEQAGIPLKCVESINVLHPTGGRTLHTFDDHKDFEQENKQKFIEKWGRMPHGHH